MGPKGATGRYAEKFVVTLARAVPVLGLLRDIFKGGRPGQGDSRGNGQLSHPPDPHYTS